MEMGNDDHHSRVYSTTTRSALTFGGRGGLYVTSAAGSLGVVLSFAGRYTLVHFRVIPVGGRTAADAQETGGCWGLLHCYCRQPGEMVVIELREKVEGADGEVKIGGTTYLHS